MSYEPFPIEQVIERLADAVSVFKRQVRGSVEYAEITGLKDFRPPEAFVVLTAEIGEANYNQPEQLGWAFFGVVIAVRNLRYERGATAAKDASPVIGLVRQALMGWQPAAAARKCQWVSGKLLDYDKGTLLWSESFKVQRFIGST